MIHEIIYLKEFYPTLTSDPTLISYCPSNFPHFSDERKRRTILLLPGGAYCFIAPNEGESVALCLLGNDINVFILRYSV